VRAPQVDVAVLQTRVLTHVDVLFHGERRRLAGIEDEQLFGDDFDFAGCDVQVDGVGGALLDDALDGDDVFRAKLLGASVQGGIGVGAEDDLGDAFAVAQVNEDHAAEIAAAVHPAHEHDAAAVVGDS